MPFVTIKMLSGRSKEQKKRLVEAVTKDVEEICNVKPESIWIVIEEVEKEHWATGGTLVSDRTS
jgi:4-oxalocrotonate tautomerase